MIFISDFSNDSICGHLAFFGHGNVHYSQLKLVVDKLEGMGENPLIIMPQKYVAPKFWLSIVGYTQELSEPELAIMNDLLDKRKMYIVPTACLVSTVTVSFPFSAASAHGCASYIQPCIQLFSG